MPLGFFFHSHISFICSFIHLFNRHNSVSVMEMIKRESAHGLAGKTLYWLGQKVHSGFCKMLQNISVCIYIYTHCIYIYKYISVVLWKRQALLRWGNRGRVSNPILRGEASRGRLHRGKDANLVFFFKINLLIYLFLAVLGLRFCARAFSSCGKRGPLFIVVHGPLTIATSLAVEHRLQTCGLSSCGSRAQLLRGMWDLPRPGLEPVSPALAGGFSTTAPPGKPANLVLKTRVWVSQA